MVRGSGPSFRDLVGSERRPEYGLGRVSEDGISGD